MTTLVEVYRSATRAACEERAFVLHAVGIGAEILAVGEGWALFTLLDSHQQAREQLLRYQRENPPRKAAVPLEPVQPWAGLGVAGYAIALLLVAWLAGRNAFTRDWLAQGVLRAGAASNGEGWRAVTALTLHFDVGHLLANLGFGVVFGLFAGQLLGPGVAWASVLVAAAGANLLNSFIQPAQLVSAGASTAVFTTLGLLSAYAWRRRGGRGERWAYRWAPLIAGVALLGFTGVGGERTDVLAHLTGFATGVLAGLLLALRAEAAGPGAQWIAGLATIAALVTAWAFALA
jgi:membrane associated rhomboid family serine protease